MSASLTPNLNYKSTPPLMQLSNQTSERFVNDLLGLHTTVALQTSKVGIHSLQTLYPIHGKMPAIERWQIS